MGHIIPLVLSTLFPIGFLAFLASQNLYRTGKFAFNVYTLAWGLIAYLLAAFVNSNLIKQGWVGQYDVVHYAAPIFEEVLKFLIVVYLVRRSDFVYIMDGIAYGFGAGIGFAVIENFEYVRATGSLEGALFLAVARVFSTNIMHATGTAIIGAALGYSRLDKEIDRFLFPIGSILFSIIAHMGFNALVNGGYQLGFAFIYAAVGAVGIYFIVRYSLDKAARTIAEELGMQDRVTSSEAAIVNRIKSIDEILEPIGAIFGMDEKEKVKNFLYLQAQLGLQRDNLNKAADGRLRDGITREVDELQRKMDTARRDVGIYCMMYVRLMFPENNLSLWALIQQRIPATGTGHKGGGLWDRVDGRIKESKVVGEMTDD
jgi:RsiW-degrading membrane proteinase PrsW (M82 family)